MHRFPYSFRPGTHAFPKQGSLLRPVQCEGLWWERQQGQRSGLDVQHLGGTDSAAPDCKRILLVDDDREERRLMRAFLEPDGYQILTCGDPLRALQTFYGRRDIDMVITDLHLPVISGLRLAEEIAAIRPEVPVLIASGSVLTSDIWRRMEAANWHFVSKPFQIPGALEMIRGLLDDGRADARFL